jgi:hypothetical protein
MRKRKLAGKLTGKWSLPELLDRLELELVEIPIARLSAKHFRNLRSTSARPVKKVPHKPVDAGLRTVGA